MLIPLRPLSLPMLLALLLPLSAWAQEGERLATIEVEVVEEASGHPIPEVPLVLRMLDGSGPAFADTTDTGGGARFEAVPEGVYVLVAAPEGFAEETRTILVRGGRHTEVVFRLLLFREMGEALVEAQRISRALERNGFYDRRDRGVGYHYSRQDIDEWVVGQFSSLFARIPNVRVMRNEVGLPVAINPIETVLSAAMGCEYDVYLDGWEATFGEEVFSLDDVAPGWVNAVEVYPRASFAPPRYRSNGCGTILIWTGQ